MAIILPTGQWYAPSAVLNDAWYSMVFHCIAWYCMVLHGIAWYCMALHYLALSYTILHYLALVIAFDIAVVAQKVKVQY